MELSVKSRRYDTLLRFVNSPYQRAAKAMLEIIYSGNEQEAVMAANTLDDILGSRVKLNAPYGERRAVLLAEFGKIPCDRYVSYWAAGCGPDEIDLEIRSGVVCKLK